jgi:hypothetical protein
MAKIMALTVNKVNPIIVSLCHLYMEIHPCMIIIVSNYFFEYLKLAHITMVHVFGLVKDKHCFNSISFLKNKVRNHLNHHLQLVVVMYAQKFFTLDNFPYQVAHDMWSNVQVAHGLG